MDDEIDFRMPHYPTSFWNSTSNGSFLNEEYHSGSLNFTGNNIPFQHTHAHIQFDMTHPVFLAVNHEDSFDGHSANLVDYQLGLHHSCNGLNDVFGLSDMPRHASKPLMQIWPASSGTSEYSSYSGDSQGSFSIPNPVPLAADQDYGRNHGTHRHPLCMNPERKFSRDADKNGSLLHGLITPKELTPERSPPPPDTKGQNSMSPPSDDNEMTSKEPTKAKRRRKSRKRQTPTQQQESGRKLLLERNRNAAARSRQKKKKWVDEITAKVNVLKDKYKSQKSQRDELEQEIQQLKLMLFLHSRSCNDDDIGLWIEEELKRVNDATSEGSGAGKRIGRRLRS